MPTFFRKNQNGFSLIEMLIYVAVLVFMLLVIIQVVISVAGSDRVIKAMRNVESSATLVLERISREARLADNIDVLASTLGSHPGHLVLTKIDGGGNLRTVEFYLSNGRVMLMEDGVETGALTSGDAYVNNLVFRRFASSTIEGVRTEINVTSGTTTSFKSETFYSSVLLR